jgi:DNA repair exonuclease SbcCD ATPase subunit
MSDRSTVAIQSMKAAQAEVVQWENRIESARNEYSSLKKQCESLEQEIIAKKTDYQTYIGAREQDLRQKSEKIQQDQKILDGQREEFRLAMDAHLKDKAAHGQAKLDFEKEKAAAMGRRTAVNDFIQAVRRAYNVLPD